MILRAVLIAIAAVFTLGVLVQGLGAARDSGQDRHDREPGTETGRDEDDDQRAA